jgi:hypothetical protein
LLTIAVVSVAAIVALCELGVAWISSAAAASGWLRATIAARAIRAFTGLSSWWWVGSRILALTLTMRPTHLSDETATHKIFQTD